MIMGYGHDDRVCAYPSLIALLNTPQVTRTGVCILVDKEEIGSVGATVCIQDSLKIWLQRLWTDAVIIQNLS